MLELYINIRNKRKEMGLSQEELAKKVGYSGKSMISKIERGEVDLSTTMIKKFADVLDTTPSELMGEPIYMDSEPDNHERLEQAIRLYEMYEKAIPEIRSAVEGLLKSAQSDENNHH